MTESQTTHELTAAEIAEMMRPSNVEYDPSMNDFAERMNHLLRTKWDYEETNQQFSDGDYIRAMKGDENVFGNVKEIVERNNRLERIAKRLDAFDKKTMEESGGYVP